MDITPLVPESIKTVQGYGPGFFRINGVLYRQSVFVVADKVVEISVDISGELLKINSIEKSLCSVDDLELLLVGTGKSFRALDADNHRALKESGLSVDVMDSGAAARTYNVLIAEQRRAGAVLVSC